MRPTMELLLINGCWMARCSEPEITELFGTDTIPTPYTSDYPASRVQHEVQARNPHAIVSIGKC
jgi:hypothetical protein